MAKQYKFWYFDGTGRGEVCRYLFSFAGQEYEDRRVTIPEWFKNQHAKGEIINGYQIHDFRSDIQFHPVLSRIPASIGSQEVMLFSMAFIPQTIDMCKVG